MPLLSYLTNGFDVKGHQNRKKYEIQDRLCKNSPEVIKKTLHTGC